jgi:hypothetical protein
MSKSLLWCTRVGFLASIVFVIVGAAESADPKPAAMPRLADGRPDLNGTWENGGGIDFVQPVKRPDGSICVRDCGGPPVPRLPPDRAKYKPEFAAKVKDLDDRQVQMDPALRCRPPGVPRIGPPDKIVQTSKEVIFLYEDISGAAFRVVAMGAKHSLKDIETSYFGDSIGRWEGDTLVVETFGFNDDTWISDDGGFHTANLRVTERLKRNGNKIEFNVVAEDPEVLAEPWRLRSRVLELSTQPLPPSIPCVEQDLSHVVDGTHHDNLR